MEYKSSVESWKVGRRGVLKLCLAIELKINTNHVLGTKEEKFANINGPFLHMTYKKLRSDKLV